MPRSASGGSPDTRHIGLPPGPLRAKPPSDPGRIDPKGLRIDPKGLRIDPKGLRLDPKRLRRVPKTPNRRLRRVRRASDRLFSASDALRPASEAFKIDPEAVKVAPDALATASEAPEARRKASSCTSEALGTRRKPRRRVGRADGRGSPRVANLGGLSPNWVLDRPATADWRRSVAFVEPSQAE